MSTTAAPFHFSLEVNPHVEEGEYVKEVAAGADIGRVVGKVVGIREDGRALVDLVTRGATSTVTTSIAPEAFFR